MSIPRTLLIALCALLLFGCASTVSLGSVEHPLSEGRYDEAVTALEANSKQLESAQGPIVLALDQGMVFHYARQFDLSNRHLDNAEGLITDAFTKSITEGVATYLVNDNARTYPGEDFEDIYSNVFKSLNYQMLGKTEDAMVEIRRATEKQQVLRDKYEKLSAKTAQAAKNNQVDGLSGDLVSIEFSHSALADYLGMLYSRRLGATADLSYFHGQVTSAFSSQPHLYPFSVPSRLDEELSVPSGKARVNVIAFSGLEPYKQEVSQYLPVSRSGWMKIALPEMEGRQSMISRVDVSIGDERFTLDLLEDLSAVAKQTFALRLQDITNRTLIRATMKAVGTSVIDVVGHGIAQSASENDRQGWGLLADLATLFSSVFSVASEQADLRMSHFFPAMARVGGINVEPGVYDVTVEFKDASGFVVGRVIYKDCHVKEGGLNLVEAVCLR
ncbi:MAG: hypothetical protein LKJ96_04040 [Sphaerochaeta sp.]|nr:hypothetical protein [Sphaerochaeta sp.]